MSLAKLSLLDLSARPAGRVAWADIAKAISILLLVFWTVVGDRLYLNEMLIFLRMPLFFFISGLFALRLLTRSSFGDILRERVGNLIYLYLLWCALLFLSIDMPLYLVRGSSIDPVGELDVLWDVNFNMWFLYALAVAVGFAWCVRRLPVLLILGVSVLTYLVSVSSGDWRYLPFIERIVRLFPFFWIGLIAFPLIREAVERHYRLWPLALGAFLGSSWLVYESPWIDQGLLTFAITLLGLAATLGLARQLSEFGWSAVLKIVGASTLYIYVMQKIVLFYLDYGLGVIGAPDSFWMDLLRVLVVVSVCVIAGQVLSALPLTAWLFRAPWLGTKPSRGADPKTVPFSAGNLRAR